MIILTNGHIYTLDPNHPTAATLVIQAGRIQEVNDDIAHKHKGVQIYDLADRTVIPGLIDAHLHLQQYALNIQKVDCETKTLHECLQRVDERCQQTLPGDWVLGHGWNQNDWQDLSKETGFGELIPSPVSHRPSSVSRLPPSTFPSAAHLDAIAPNHPVYLTAKSLHAAWVNSAVLQMAGITAQTPDPTGGQILHDPHGNPTGILLESAMQMVNNFIPEPTIDQLVQAIQAAQSKLWQMGLTGLHDFDRSACFSALQEMQATNQLGLRVIKSIPIEDLSAAITLGLRTGYGNDFLRIGSVKLFADGALGPRTAAMFQPYEGETDQCGMLLLDAEALFEQGKIAVENGLSLAVHAIGDLANHEVLNAFEKLRKVETVKLRQSILRNRNLRHRNLRHRIEHVQLIRSDDARRFEPLGIIASMQPIHAPSDMLMADRNWGERSANAYAWRMLLNHNAGLAFGSDAPVESPNPFWGLYAAVTRRRADGTPTPNGWYPEQRLSIMEAIQGYTTGAAYAGGMEHCQGKLAPGFLADLLVLDDDPFTCQPEHLLDIRPVATMVDGEWVFQEIFD